MVVAAVAQNGSVKAMADVGPEEEEKLGGFGVRRLSAKPFCDEVYFANRSIIQK